MKFVTGKFPAVIREEVEEEFDEIREEELDIIMLALLLVTDEKLLCCCKVFLILTRLIK